MNVRVKLFGILFIFVLIVSGVYFGTTQGYLESRFGYYAAKEAAAVFEDFYVGNGGSWEGVAQLDVPEDGNRDKHGGIALLSPDGRLLYHKGAVEAQTVTLHGFHKEIMVSGKEIGTAYTYQWATDETLQMKDYIQSSMLIEGLRVGTLTFAVSLLLGLWLMWRLTLPLKRMIPSIRKVTQGDFRIHIPVTSKDEYGQVTEALNQMARQLERAEEIRKQLTADVTHELRTPLAILQSQLEIIQSGGRAVSPETLLPIQDEVIRLTKLIEDLHQLTLAESGTLPVYRQTTDLVTLMDRTLDMFGWDAEERKIRITRKYATESLIVDIDPNRMTQAFYNLLSNALRYTSSGGQVLCEIAHTEHNGTIYASISIADTGIGISEDKLPFLFERFYRVDEARSRNSGGMGLGLAIAKGFVEAHQGSISVRSNIGDGTTFTVLLPIS